MGGRVNWLRALVLAILLGACAGSPTPQVLGGASTRSPRATARTATPTWSASPAVGVSAAAASPSARASGALPPGCSRAAVTRLIESFFTAFNAGEQAQLARFFPEQRSRGGDDTGFQWYSVTEGSQGTPEFRHFSAHSRSELLAYFAARHAQGERLRLLEVGVGPSWQPGVGEILYTLTRTADDLPPGLGGPKHLARGKGAIDCARQTIFVWSMAMS